MKTITLILIFISLAGCATTGAMSQVGYSFIGSRVESGGIAYNKGEVKKSGESCAVNIFGLFAFGDSGIYTAQKNGGLERVFYYDKEIINVIGLFGQVCTKVYGI